MDIGTIINTTQSKVNELGQNVQKEMQESSTTDPDKMIKIQFSLQQYSNYLQYESTIIKSFKDMISGVIQNM